MVKKICCLIYRKTGYNFKFLILHKNNWWNGWELVRGEARMEENVKDAALREVNEETGLNIADVRIMPFNYSYDYLKGLNKVSAEVSCFAAKTDDENVTLSNEHNYYKWVDYDEAIKLLDYEEQKKLLELFNREIIPQSIIS